MLGGELNQLENRGGCAEELCIIEDKEGNCRSHA